MLRERLTLRFIFSSPRGLSCLSNSFLTVHESFCLPLSSPETKISKKKGNYFFVVVYYSSSVIPTARKANSKFPPEEVPTRFRLESNWVKGPARSGHIPSKIEMGTETIFCSGSTGRKVAWMRRRLACRAKKEVTSSKTDGNARRKSSPNGAEDF